MGCPYAKVRTSNRGFKRYPYPNPNPAEPHYEEFVVAVECEPSNSVEFLAVHKAIQLAWFTLCDLRGYGTLHVSMLLQGIKIQWNLQIRTLWEKSFCPLFGGCPLVGRLSQYAIYSPLKT